MLLSKRVLPFILVLIFLFAQSAIAFTAEELNINDPRLEKAIILYVGSSTAFVHNVRTEIDAINSAVFPIVKNGRTLVPVRFIAESLGADVSWDATSNTVVIKLNDRTVKMVLGQQVIITNDIKTILDVPAQTINGRTFIPLRALVEALGQQVDYINGLIIISTEAKLIDSKTEIDLVNQIIAMFNPIGNVSTPATMKYIAGGNSFSAAIGDDGTVWTWGDNGYGQLGNGTSISSSIPRKINGLSGFKAVACGANHTLALNDDGTVWAWGHNMNKQLGYVTKYSTNKTPDLVKGLSNVKSLAAGVNHSVALKNDGTVWTWGRNWEGQLGRKTAGNEVATPGMIKELTGVISIAAIGDYTAALKNDGTVWICGDVSDDYQTKVMKAVGLDGIKSIALTNDHIAALKSDGTVLLFHVHSRKIKTVPNFTDIKLISCNQSQIAALKNNGSLWISGVTYAVSGSLFVDDPDFDTSRMVEGVTDVKTIATGYNHIMILKNDGTVWGLGNNKSGQLGNGINIIRSVPDKVIGLSKTTAIDATSYQSMALLDDGSVSVWGEDGGPSYFWDNNSTPKVISGLNSLTGIAGTWGAYAVLKSDGSVWCWGGSYGDVPTKVETLESITAIAGGENYDYRYAALKKDGTVWEWDDRTEPF